MTIWLTIAIIINVIAILLCAATVYACYYLREQVYTLHKRIIDRNVLNTTQHQGLHKLISEIKLNHKHLVKRVKKLEEKDEQRH